jgi:nucleotide-binding universal stress UspA family protein
VHRSQSFIITTRILMTARSVVVPIDFSAHSRAAAELGLAALGREGGELVLVHADPLPGAASTMPEPFYIAPQLWAAFGSAHTAKVNERLGELKDELAARAPDSVTIRTELVQNDAAPGIVALAEELGAELIALGSHGASATTIYLFGSVTEKVVRTAPCPVLVTNADIQDRAGEPGPFKHAVVGIDFSPLSIRAARAAAEILAPGGVLEFVHVWHAPYLPTMELSLQTRRDELYQLIETYRRAEVERLNKFILDLDLRLDSDQQHAYIEVGSAPRGILRRAEDTGADLIVLGAHGRETLQEKLLGTVADRVLRSAALPVLLIPEASAAREAP